MWEEHMSVISNNKSEMIKHIEKFIDANKCNNIKSYYIESIEMWFVVASVESDRHASSVVKNLLTTLKDQFGLSRYRIEGDSNWVILDAENVLVHVFRTEVREYYNVDSLWSGNERIPNVRLG